ncbi:MAG: sugar kinase [Chloroflexota bacterium]|nr:sugar kinase [Chloroflexota bacterium]
MSLDLLTFGEALVEVMRTTVDQPLDQPAPFIGPYPSGAPFIFAVQAARLGVRAAAIGAIGDDWFGKCQLRQLEHDGVDTRGVHILPGYTTGVAFIAYASDGSREYVFHARHAAAGQLNVALLDHDDTRALFDGLKCLHIMGSALSMSDGAYELGLRAVQIAREAGAKISFDPNIRPQLIDAARARTRFAPFVDAADVLMPTDAEALTLTGETELDFAVGRLFAGKPGRIVVIHRGKAGAVVFQRTADGVRADAIPAYAVEEIDPTGAGDCFAAGFLARWLAGDAPEVAARFGCACGALAVTKMGPMAGAHDLEAVQRFMGR